MTIKEARKIIGKEADHLSDEEILRDMETAELLKNLFFQKILNPRQNTPKISGNNLQNVP